MNNGIHNKTDVVECENCGDDPVAAELFMQAAACSAKAGVKLQHGGPFGACVVKGGIIISCSHNQVLLNADPTCHAEMTAVRQACAALQTHDLSDCELYTTCEPCPMCWGACQWSRLSKVYIGADRFTAAKYGFDDKVFYDEVEHHATCFGLHRYGSLQDSNKAAPDGKAGGELVHKNMMEVHCGVLRTEAEALFTGAMNKTYHRRLGQGQGLLREVYERSFTSPESPKTAGYPSPEAPKTAGYPVQMPDITVRSDEVDDPVHEPFMRRAIALARKAAKDGYSKEREPFGAVIVRNGEVIGAGTNSVLRSRDATATAEVNAIRAAAACLGDYNLDGCSMYTTTVPDVMSMSACLWARIPKVFCGVTQEFALRHGHEEGVLHFKELMCNDLACRSIPVVANCARPACEDAFQFWSSLAGKVY